MRSSRVDPPSPIRLPPVRHPHQRRNQRLQERDRSAYLNGASPPVSPPARKLCTLHRSRFRPKPWIEIRGGPTGVTELKDEAIALGRDERLRAILRDICETTHMGFAAVARVTEQRWIACLVEDRIDFGLDPGGELKIHETICDEIRDSGEAVVIDDASDDIKWSRHPVPVIYGFKSYCSFPVYLEDGTFFGTLCAIDTEPRHVDDEAIIAMFSSYARTVGAFLSEALREKSNVTSGA